MKPYSSNFSGKNLALFHDRLHAWYRAHGRHHLPWRTTSNAYHILVSEMMLQQTQVDTVLNRFYQPFLVRFPSLETLAAASRESVMHAWQGLGYYRRAGFLHEAAKRAGEKLPDTVDELMKLPGIGKNTAHALLAFAHHNPYPVMEANVKRILCRIFAFAQPKEVELWTAAEALLDHTEPFDYNQAMMDLGAMICTVKAPKCDTCPANHFCIGQIDPERFPAKKEKRETPIRSRYIFVVQDTAGRVYATPRKTALLGGLYQFIECDEPTETVQLNYVDYLKQEWQYLGHITQKYSHFTLEAEVYRLLYEGRHQAKYWHDQDALKRLPWSKAEEKILNMLGGLRK